MWLRVLDILARSTLVAEARSIAVIMGTFTNVDWQRFEHSATLDATRAFAGDFVSWAAVV
jgi:hypothetical protein